MSTIVSDKTNYQKKIKPLVKNNEGGSTVDILSLLKKNSQLSKKDTAQNSTITNLYSSINVNYLFKLLDITNNSNKNNLIIQASSIALVEKKTELHKLWQLIITAFQQFKEHHKQQFIPVNDFILTHAVDKLDIGISARYYNDFIDHLAQKNLLPKQYKVIKETSIDLINPGINNILVDTPQTPDLNNNNSLLNYSSATPSKPTGWY
jgi:hypothetical protein